MNCPICENEAMIILELDDVEVDYCVACSGVWLDEGELELLLDEAEKKENVLESFAAASNSTEEIVACPVCGAEMKKIKIGAEEIIIDKCPDNHGLWFDQGELEEIIDLGTVKDDNKILKLLRNMFAYQE